MVYVSFENQSQKSLSQLIDQLKEAGNMEATALSALQDAVGAYKKCNPGPEYWEGFLAQILALFPFEVVKKQAEDVEAEAELVDIRLESGRQIEDLQENLAAMERELAEVRAERDELWATLQDPEAEATLHETAAENEALKAERDELKAQLAEWELKGNELANANGLIESSVGDRQSFEEEKRLIIQGFEERVTFFEKEINRYRELEKEWGTRFAQQSEEFKKLTEDRDNLLLRCSEYNETLSKWREKEVQPAIDQAEKYDRLLTQCEKELDQAKKTIEILESSGNRRELEEQILRLTAEVEKLQNGTPIPESDVYIEFVKLSDTAGYLKVRESGEILAAYVGTNNQKNESGRILGKSILKDWQSHFQILYSKSGSEIRKAKRLKTDWELKITGLPFEKIEKLGTYDYTQPPQQRPQQKPENKPEIELVKVPEFDPLCPEYKVVVSGEEFGRVWKIPGKLPSEWKHNLFGPQSRPFKSPEEAAKELVMIEREAEAETTPETEPEF